MWDLLHSSHWRRLLKRHSVRVEKQRIEDKKKGKTPYCAKETKVKVITQNLNSTWDQKKSSEALKKKITQAINLTVVVAKTLNKKENEATKQLQLLFFHSVLL